MIEDDIVAILRGAKNVINHVDNRIGPELGESKETKPYITYRRISTDHLEGSTGSSGTARASIVVTAWSQSYKQTKQLAEAVRMALQGYTDNNCVTITMTDDNDITQAPQSAENRPTFGVEMDFGVWFVEPIPS